MPEARMFMRTLDIKRLLDYKQQPTEDLDVRVNIRAMDIKPMEKGKAHMLLDVVYSVQEAKKERRVMEARVEIDVIYEEKEEKLAEIYEAWNKNHTVMTDVYRRVGQSAFNFSLYSIMPLTERMRLPPLLPPPTATGSPKKDK